jgi:hypothetical protein
MAAIEGFSVSFDPQGTYPLTFTPRAESLRWSTLAVGGFGSCSFSIPGIEAHRRIPYLTPVVVSREGRVIYEGRVEDKGLTISSSLESRFECFGWKRVLDESSVRRIWSERNLVWKPVTNRSTLGVSFDAGAVSIAEGTYDPADLSKRGLKFFGADKVFGGAAGFGDGRTLVMPDGFIIERWKGTYRQTQALMLGTFFRSDDGSSFSVVQTYGDLIAATAFDHDLSANAVTQLSVTYETDGINQPGPGDYLEVYDMRLLCTTLNEDATGGFYGGTILTDLLNQFPDIAAGTIDSGNDFLIQSMARADRTSGLSVVEEVASFYEREWGVWEDRKFNWRDRGNQHYIVDLNDCEELSITGSVEELARKVYVLYTDAGSGRQDEEVATATSQLNPYVRQGVTKDQVVQAGFPMTSATATQLAARLAADYGAYPPITGRVVIPAERELVNNITGRVPAFYLRGGDNVVFPQLPDNDPFSQGRDGQTVFHINSAEVDLDSGNVTLELEGQTRSSDVLLARLAHVTRTLTG